MIQNKKKSLIKNKKQKQNNYKMKSIKPRKIKHYMKIFLIIINNYWILKIN